MEDQSFISVVIPTYNRERLLDQALRSLLDQSYPQERYEIIVVDDGSLDGTAALVQDLAQKYPGRLQYFRQTNRGPAAARNLGIHRAKGEFIAFIDDDCIADSHWLREITQGYDLPLVAGVGGTIKSGEASTLAAQYCAHIRMNETPGIIGDRIVWLITANASFRREALTLANGFDESIDYPGGEDADLCLRLVKHGFTFKYNPHAVVFHRHKQSGREFIATFYNYGKGTCFYMMRNGQNLKGALLAPPNFLSLLSFLKMPWIVANYWRKEGLDWRRSLAYAFLTSLKDATIFVGKVIGIRYYLHRGKTIRA